MMVLLESSEYVYVNQDGSVREWSPDEREYLSEEFQPGDGARPYFKSSYVSKDGWGSVSGFLHRDLVPMKITIEPVNPDYVPPPRDAMQNLIDESREAGYIVVENPNGSISIKHNPAIPAAQQLALLREVQLRRQREREKLARHPAYLS